MKKKKAGIAAALITTAFTLAAGTAAHLEWVGYDYFTRKDGSNLLCKIDPYCRALTAQEISTAQKYFGDHIDYKMVKVFNRPFMLLSSEGYSGISPNGHLYFSKNDYRPDFAAAPALTPLFIHEMTHVAQYQSGMNLPKQAFRTWLKHNFNYAASYHYEIEQAESYSKFDFEQQAQIMADYYAHRAELEWMATPSISLNSQNDMVSFSAVGDVWLKNQCKKLKAYEAKLSPIYPILPDALCMPRPKSV